MKKKIIITIVFIMALAKINAQDGISQQEKEYCGRACTVAESIIKYSYDNYKLLIDTVSKYSRFILDGNIFTSPFTQKKYKVPMNGYSEHNSVALEILVKDLNKINIKSQKEQVYRLYAEISKLPECTLNSPSVHIKNIIKELIIIYEQSWNRIESVKNNKDFSKLFGMICNQDSAERIYAPEVGWSWHDVRCTEMEEIPKLQTKVNLIRIDAELEK